MKSSLIIAILLTLSLSACAPRTGGIAMNSAGQLQVDNTRVAKDVSISEIRSRSVGGFLQASALVGSKTSTDQQLQYKFTWYDLNGFVIDDDASPWIALQLFGGQRRQVQAVAPDASAVRFQLYVRQVFSE